MPPNEKLLKYKCKALCDVSAPNDIISNQNERLCPPMNSRKSGDGTVCAAVCSTFFVPFAKSGNCANAVFFFFFSHFLLFFVSGFVISFSLFKCHTTMKYVDDLNNCVFPIAAIFAVSIPTGSVRLSARCHLNGCAHLLDKLWQLVSPLAFLPLWLSAMPAEKVIMCIYLLPFTRELPSFSLRSFTATQFSS